MMILWEVLKTNMEHIALLIEIWNYRKVTSNIVIKVYNNILTWKLSQLIGMLLTYINQIYCFIYCLLLRKMLMLASGIIITLRLNLDYVTHISSALFSSSLLFFFYNKNEQRLKGFSQSMKKVKNTN